MTREQQRALTAHRQVSEFMGANDSSAQKKYRSITLKAQSLIRNAGLCQALHFIQGKPDFRPLVGHLKTHLEEGCVLQTNDFLKAIREAPLPVYLAATREALHCLTWQCRIVQTLIEEV